MDTNNLSMSRPTVRSRIHYQAIMRKLEDVVSSDALLADLASQYALLVSCSRFEGEPASWWVTGKEDREVVERAFEAFCDLPASVYDELVKLFALVNQEHDSALAPTPFLKTKRGASDAP
jgi:hypothetical protein